VAKSFGQMVAEAKAEVPGLSPQDAQARMQQNPKAVVIDVRQAEDVKETGIIPGALNVPLGVLAIKADQDLPAAITDARLQDRDQEVIVTCAAGGQASLGAKTLKDMGFTNVSYVDGGTRGWKAAGLPTE
jgi:rhodanese-related sulfurtransferase